MDAIICPREPPPADLEAGLTTLQTSTQETDVSEIQPSVILEDSHPPRTDNEEYIIREWPCFPDGETKEECLERFKIHAEELKRSFGINKTCGMLN